MRKKKIVTGVVARRAAQRALWEGAEATSVLIGTASGLRPKTLEQMAAKEGWKTPPQADTPAQRDRRIVLLMDQLVGELEAVKKDAKTGRYDKAGIDALSAMMRMLEKLAEINESRQARQEEEQKTDAEVADILRRIDERILGLAREFARELAGSSGAEGPAADRE